MSDESLQELLEGLSPTSRILYAEATIGKDAEELVHSELGRAMVGIAQQDYTEAVLGLATVSWWRKGKIRDLQQKAANAKSFLTYLQELILRGRQAQKTLTEGESSDA